MNPSDSSRSPSISPQLTELRANASPLEEACGGEAHSHDPANDLTSGASPLFSEFFYSSNTGLAILDDRMRYQAVNSRLAEINGVPAEAHLGKTIREIIGEVASQAEPVIRQIISTGRPLAGVQFDGVLPRQTQRRHWVDHLFPLKNANGRVVSVGAVVVEIFPMSQTAGRLSPQTETVPDFASDILRSWKDISNYVGACTKTVQRWEKYYNFPIRRLEKSKGAVVFALKPEIDSWIFRRTHQKLAS